MTDSPTLPGGKGGTKSEESLDPTTPDELPFKSIKDDSTTGGFPFLFAGPGSRDPRRVL